MNDKTRIRFGIGLIGLLTFTGSLLLISKTDKTGTTADIHRSAYETNESLQQIPVPESYAPFTWEYGDEEEDDDEIFLPQFKPPVQLPQTRTHVS